MRVKGRSAPAPPVAARAAGVEELEEELLLRDPEVDCGRDAGGPIDEARAEQLSQGDRVVIPGHGGDEALVEVDALELDPAPGVAVDQITGGALHRLDVEDRHDRRQVGHVRLDQDRPGENRLAAEATLLVLVGVAGGAEEPVGELSGEPVGAARAECDRSALRIDPADRLVAEASLGGQPGDDLGPLLGLGTGAQSTLTRSSRPWDSSSAL